MYSIQYILIILGNCKLDWEATTKRPPLVSVKASLPPFSAQINTRNTPSTVKLKTQVNLTAVVKCLLRPVVQNDRIVASRAFRLGFLADGVLRADVNWNSLGFGSLSTTIKLPKLVDESG